MYKMNLNEYFSAVRNGDKEAFAQIYDELEKPVFTIVSRIVQSKEIAEDVTQDIFVKLFVSPPDSSVKNPRAWIFQMTRNLAINALKKKQGMDVDDLELVADDQISNVVMRMDIESAISRLPRLEREILSLHINAGLHFNEISNIVGLSLPATYRKYRKAIKTLREFLGGDAL